MEAELQCIICLEYLSNPVTFPCSSHSICKDPCFLKLLQAHPSFPPLPHKPICLECPVCGDNGPKLIVDQYETVPVNKVLSRIINLHKNIQILATNNNNGTTNLTTTPMDDEKIDNEGDNSIPRLKCEACNNVASVECVNCGCFLCEKHNQDVHIAGILKQHARFPILYSSNSKNISPPTPRLCSTHGKLKDLFCVQDNQLICSYCLVSDSSTHHSHECKRIDQAAVFLHARLNSYNMDLGQALTSRTQVLKNLVKLQEDVQISKKELEMEIDFEMDELLKLVQKKREALKNDVGLCAQTKLGIIELQHSNYHDEVEKIEGLLRDMKMMPDDPFEFVPRAIEIEETIKQINPSAPIPPPKLTAELTKELHAESVKKAVENLILSSLPVETDIEIDPETTKSLVNGTLKNATDKNANKLPPLPPTSPPMNSPLAYHYASYSNFPVGAPNNSNNNSNVNRNNPPWAVFGAPVQPGFFAPPPSFTPYDRPGSFFSSPHLPDTNLPWYYGNHR